MKNQKISHVFHTFYGKKEKSFHFDLFFLMLFYFSSIFPKKLKNLEKQEKMKGFLLFYIFYGKKENPFIFLFFPNVFLFFSYFPRKKRKTKNWQKLGKKEK